MRYRYGKRFTFSDPMNRRHRDNGVAIRKVRCRTTGRTYDSAKIAATELKLSIASISSSCVKDRVVQGLLFEYVK